MNAPVCVAKGVDAIALKIREVAERACVPVVENPPLARALHATVEIDQEIPAEHYQAVAEVIGYVMRLRRAVGRIDANVPLADQPVARERTHGNHGTADSRRDMGAAQGPWRAGSSSQPSTAAGRGGSIGLVLLVALVLVGAAVGLLFVGRGNAALYILIAARGARHRRRVLAVRAGLRHPALRRQGRRRIR